MRNADVLIVGGGIIGLMTGWLLARRRVRVRIVDSGMPAASDAAAGMLAPSFERSLHKAGDALADFSRESLARWRDLAPLLEERSGVSIDFDVSGILCAVFAESDAAAFEADAEGGERLDRRAALALEPALSTDIIGGWFAAGDGQVDPRRARLALEKALANDGGELRRGGTATRLLSAGGRVSGVVLASGEQLSAPIVILATGARVDGFAGLPAGAVFPVKGEALAAARIGGSNSRVVRTKRAYLCPKADGRIIIGATETPGDWSLNPDADRVAALKAGARAAIPSLEHAPEIDRWAGLRPATRDGAPIIGDAPEGPDGLFLALGHYRNGVLLAPATADALAGRLVEGRLPLTAAAFSAARFTRLGVS